MGQTKEELSEGFCIMQYSERCKKQEGKRKHSLFYTLKQGQGREYKSYSLHDYVLYEEKQYNQEHTTSLRDYWLHPCAHQMMLHQH